MRLARWVALVAFSSVANFHSFLFKFGQHGILDRHAVVNGCKMQPGYRISHAFNDMVDEDIGGFAESLKRLKGQLDYLFFSFVHVGSGWVEPGMEPGGVG